MEMYSDLQIAFLYLMRLGIGHTDNRDILPFDTYDWEAIKALAARQGLSGILTDGIDCLPLSNRPPEITMLKLIGSVSQKYEYRYELYRKAIAELASFYNKHGFKMMILKGYACSLDWPKPEHRPSGDIDIWLFGQQIAADKELELWFKDQGFTLEIDNSHHHHTVFFWRDFIVENHYDFINVHARKSNQKLERIFKELGTDDTNYIEVNGERVYLPSANLHSLFLIRHLVAHFAAAKITLRHVFDWAFFVEKHGRDVNWGWLVNVLEAFGFRRFFDVINSICIEDLKFCSELFPYVQVDSSVKQRVLGDILDPEFDEELPSRFFSRLWFRYHRWQANAWKQNLCYKESRWSVFFSGMWSHLLKPNSI